MDMVINFPITMKNIHMLSTTKDRFNDLVNGKVYYDLQSESKNENFNVGDVVIYKEYDEDTLFDVMKVVSSGKENTTQKVLFLRRMTPIEKNQNIGI